MAGRSKEFDKLKALMESRADELNGSKTEALKIVYWEKIQNEDGKEHTEKGIDIKRKNRILGIYLNCATIRPGYGLDVRGNPDPKLKEYIESCAKAIGYTPVCYNLPQPV